ncbi:hypothetical protein G3641_003104 [Salmonella enterica]|nr:hypothetical protein [Salmonella enterica]
MMNKKHTNHHLLKNDIKTESYNMMMHEKSKMRQIPRRCRPAGSTFLKCEQLSTTTT